MQTNAQFKLANVTKEETQYYHLISRLPQEVILNSSDIVAEEFTPGALNRLKQALVKRYTLSTEQRIKEVLDNIQFTPSEAPSAFFRRLWSTANDALPYDEVIQRFRDRLPANIANTIAPMTNKMHKTHTIK